MTAVVFDFHVHDRKTIDAMEDISLWLTSIDVDPKDVKSGYVTAGPSGYEVRLLQYVRNKDGQLALDPLRNRVRTVERTVAIGDHADWPGAVS